VTSLEGHTCFPYLEELSASEIQRLWFEAWFSFYKDNQDMVDPNPGHYVRFVEDKTTRIDRYVLRACPYVPKAQPGDCLPRAARWDPEAKVWIRYTKSFKKHKYNKFYGLFGRTTWWPKKAWKIRLRDIGADTVLTYGEPKPCFGCNSRGHILRKDYPWNLNLKEGEGRAVCGLCEGTGDYIPKLSSQVDRPKSKLIKKPNAQV
jgi:hypothetical protein